MQSKPPREESSPSHAGFESRLSGSDAVVRAAFESTPDAVVVVDAQGDLLACNRRFLALGLFPAETLERADIDEMRRHFAQRLVDPDGFLARVAGPAQVRPGEVLDEVALLDGRLFERHAAPLLSAPGGGMVVFWRDVTERKRARERQQALQHQIDLAMTAAEIQFWDIQIEAGEPGADIRPWLAMLGYASDDIVNSPLAWDALVHPDDAARREAAWQAHVQGSEAVYDVEFRIRHKAGHWVWLLARGRALTRDAGGRATRVMGVRIDITQRKRAELLLEERAFTDSLTGTLTRRRFFELAAGELVRAQRYAQPLAMLVVDLDHFKLVNDHHGHAAGDAVLQAFAQAGRSLIRQSDLFGRVGGEEFALLLPQSDVEGAVALAQRLCQYVRTHPVAVDSERIEYTVSVGVAAGEAASGLDVEALMRAADRALYRAKDAGRDRVVLATRD